MTARRCDVFYQTQYTDPTTNDTLMQSRWYSPGTATFRSRDTWAGDLNTPVTLNRYTYAHNNPIRYWDPSGFCAEGLGDLGPICLDQGVNNSVIAKIGDPTNDSPRGPNSKRTTPSGHCLGKSDCRPMVAVGDQAQVVAPSSSEVVDVILNSSGLSDRNLDRIDVARTYSDMSDGSFLTFDELYLNEVHYTNEPGDRALYGALEKWDGYWAPGSDWHDGCNASLNHPSNTGYDYCSPNARMSAGALLLGVAGGFSPVAQSRTVLGGVATRDATSSILDDVAFAQRNFSESFSRSGTFSGLTIDDVAMSLRSTHAQSIRIADVPIQTVVRNGNTIVLNTRSAQALARAGIPRSQWSVTDLTGHAAAEARLTAQLARSGLDAGGIFNPVSRGF